jgi:tetratricopeptide (TPR) repeat protein
VAPSPPTPAPSSGAVGELRRWKRAALAALGVILIVVPLSRVIPPHRRAAVDLVESQDVTFVGRESCIPCHEQAYRAWYESDHDRSMAEANEETVLGDFDNGVFEHRGITSRFEQRDGSYFVHTEGPDGKLGRFEIAYTFGHDPLQQYLVRFPGGRLQALSIAWDVDAQRWFHLYPDADIPPDDWLHWTRNAQNWNGMCAECHSTDLRKKYDAVADRYTTTWAEIDVSCEACHGAGSRHVAWAEIPPMARPDLENDGLIIPSRAISARQEVELCAPCHSRRTELGDYDHSRVPLLDNQLPALLREGLYHADGQIQDEVYVYGSFVQSKMFHNDVRCSDCHDVHSLKLRHEGNALCVQCHRADAYDTADHHFHKKIHEGKPSDGALCVKCHMPETTYMVIDERADHSLRIPRPDLTLEIGTPNTCNQSGCHMEKSTEWAAAEYEKWYGKARKPHYGTILAAGRRGDPEAHEALRSLVENPLYPTIVRATALSLLQSEPGETSARVWRRALMDDEALLRYTAVQSLDVSDTAELAALVAPLLFDPARAVRLQAAARLAGEPAGHLEPYQREALEREIEQYQRSMEYSLDFAFAGLNLGNLYNQLGDADRAEAYYRKAIQIDELFLPAKMNLAVLLDAQGNTSDAVVLLREILEAYPENHNAAYSLALGLAGLQRYEEAELYLARAVEGMPEHARAHYNRGLLLQQLGRDEDAERSLARALELEPASWDYLYALADFYVKRNRVDAADRIASRLIAAHPEQRAGHDLKAWVEARRAGGGR